MKRKFKWANLRKLLEHEELTPAVKEKLKNRKRILLENLDLVNQLLSKKTVKKGEGDEGKA